MRAWFLTCTTYGNWLPGDPRGSVTSVRDERPGDETQFVRFEHDLPGEPYEEFIPGLYRHAQEHMKGPPIRLDLAKAEAMLAQFRETATYRNWSLRAVSIMANHFHIVVIVPGDPDPDMIMGDFKAYASRKLNQIHGKPVSETWWTTRGSKRKLPDEAAIAAAIHYTLYKQPYPLVIWSPELGRIV